MSSLFYAHIIEIHTLTEKLDELDLKDNHKKHLSELIDSTIHHTVLDVILSSLSEEDKKLFIEKLRQDPNNQELMDFLKERVVDIEDQIRKAVKELKKELHEDIEESVTLRVKKQ